MLRYLLPILLAALLGVVVWAVLRRRADRPARRRRRLDPADSDPRARWLRHLQWAGGVLPVVSLLLLMSGETAMAMECLGAWVLLAGGFAALSAGLKAEARGASAMAPAGSGAVLVAGGAGALQVAVGAPLSLSVLLGLGAGASALILVGPQLWPKTAGHHVPAETRRRRFAEGRRRIDDLRDTAQQIPDAGLRDRLDALADRADRVLDLAEGSAADSARSRRFLGVWLVGMVDATRAFVTAEAAGDHARTARYAKLLDDLETALLRLEASIRERDLTRFDVEIETLSERLATEGLV